MEKSDDKPDLLVVFLSAGSEIEASNHPLLSPDDGRRQQDFSILLPFLVI
jgi:hypothetical protein